jgi:hypothetical protein
MCACHEFEQAETSTQGSREAVVLPAWDGSKNALAGSESGFSRRKSGDLGPVQANVACIRNRQWQSPDRYHKKPNSQQP